MTTPQQIFLYLNGTLLATQDALNLVAGNGLTISPRVGGGVIFAASGGITNLSPYSGVPSGSGNTFTVPNALVMATVSVNGLALLPETGYTQDGTTFTLTTALVEGDTIFIQGWY